MPGLPDDVVAYFCVNNDKLVLSIYTLTTLPVPPQSSVSLFHHYLAVTVWLLEYLKFFEII